MKAKRDKVFKKFEISPRNLISISLSLRNLIEIFYFITQRIFDNAKQRLKMNLNLLYIDIKNVITFVLLRIKKYYDIKYNLNFLKLKISLIYDIIEIITFLLLSSKN